jgi:hypothetical protein
MYLEATELAKPKITRQERHLENYAYKQYLYEKYRIAFSKKRLRFFFRGQEYKLDDLMLTLHRIEQDKRALNHYVTALFVAMLSLGYWAVYSLDAYLQTIQ